MLSVPRSYVGIDHDVVGTVRTVSVNESLREHSQNKGEGQVAKYLSHSVGTVWLSHYIIRTPQLVSVTVLCSLTPDLSWTLQHCCLV